ncbi:DivIVA domain-containing protein [Maridesulfovibrio hydrothermalis]|uniref:DivIVA family protein n=1 Tax=Maridesulfovibrio hydrothermalis AM13 = DSM 14728 TaxID=1121451 RepID=L0RDF9_9BACT|nr:DivIVA domain-containing protein [Maridesulfovibrio hydrothermalis]CCO24808.1 DivIVA family protein [Maridesulfovibrio hydrothermalis AM13 = DSM 14728]
MSLSKIDLLNKKFSKSLFGYSKSEVDQLMIELADVLGTTADEKKQLMKKVGRRESTITEFRQREETLRDTLMTTQKMVDDLKAAARKEAEVIINEAHSRAEVILQQAHNRLAQIHEDINELKRQRTRFEVELKALLESHLRTLEISSPELEKVEAIESKLKFFKKAK